MIGCSGLFPVVQHIIPSRPGRAFPSRVHSGAGLEAQSSLPSEGGCKMLPRNRGPSPAQQGCPFYLQQTKRPAALNRPRLCGQHKNAPNIGL